MPSIPHPEPDAAIHTYTHIYARTHTDTELEGGKEGDREETRLTGFICDFSEIANSRSDPGPSLPFSLFVLVPQTAVELGRWFRNDHLAQFYSLFVAVFCN